MSPGKRWYVINAKIKSRAARRAAIEIAEWISAGAKPDRNLDETELFEAMHTSAYRSTRRPRGRNASQTELDEWAERWQLIREYIFEQNLGLAYTMLGQFNGAHFDRDDLLSEAMVGLMRAVDRFNPCKGYRFSTYACNVIARALRRLGRREHRYQKRIQAYHAIVPDWRAQMPDTGTELYVERLQRVMERNLAGLTKLESKILAKRFPDDHSRRLTFRKIGDTVGLSKERVRQIQQIALDKIGEVLHEDPVLQCG